MTDKPRRRLPRSVREQEIIDAALRVFSRRGYRAAVVDEIAELAGISKPMVYLYLGSKEGLFIACVRREAGRLVAAFREAASAVDEPEERLWAGLSAFFAFVAERRASWLVLHRQVPEQSEAVAAELAAARRSVMAEVAGLVGEGITRGRAPAVRLTELDADFVAHALVGAADSLTDWMERHPGESPERVTLRLMNMTWVGMRNVLAGQVWAPEGQGA
ncbi:TetR/AcrR family transcriptional regulator [Streptomyces avicenniae]|uniref:TetR/AcrR family transcriptional regulator n=1 Tax=Streptomyces avicenniae TaxID=500153 RepID=UPI00069A6CA7|nr:TetR/AcrR family transcriptional regulator [Streptomyces avicenniae]